MGDASPLVAVGIVAAVVVSMIAAAPLLIGGFINGTL